MNHPRERRRVSNRGGWRTGDGLRVAAAALLIAALGQGPARAGAWLLPKGEGLAITTGLASRASEGFDEKGRRGRAGAFRKAEIETLVEYGVSPGFTLRARSEWRRFRVEDRPADAGFGFSEIGGRVRLFQRGALVVSAEGSARLAEARDTVRPALLRGYESEVDARLLAGTGFTLAGRPAFANVEAAYRLRDGGRPDELRADLTLGFRPWPRTLLLVQGFGAFALAGASGDGYDQVKLQGSVVQDLTPRLAVQAGAFTSLAGRNALAEEGVLLALWVRF